MAKGQYSSKAWEDRDDLSRIKDLGLLYNIADSAIRYTRQTVKNLMKNVGETRAIRSLLESPYFDIKTNSKDEEVLSASLSDKTRGELIQMIKAMQSFKHSTSKTKSGLSKWADRQRALLSEAGYRFQDYTFDVELDWIYSMIREVIEAFGDMKSPPNVVEAIWEVVMNNEGLSFEEIKDEVLRKIQEGEYDIIDSEVIWNHKEGWDPKFEQFKKFRM